MQAWGLPGRLVFLSITFALELLLIPIFAGRDGLSHQVNVWGPSIVRCVITFAVVFMTFAWLRHKASLESISEELSGSPIRFSFLTAHFFSVTIFVLGSYFVYGKGSISGGSAPKAFASAWVAVGALSMFLAGFGVIPRIFWLRIVRASKFLWLWAALAAILACLSGSASQYLWTVTTSTTFRSCQLLLSPFISQMIVDPANLVIGTTRFSVRIEPGCSGLEGMGLILAFGVLWLILFRKESRFPHAFLLLPTGLAIIFALNVVRIAALVLIGNAGGEDIAIHGFHSQIGWMIFNLVAVSFAVASRRVPSFKATASMRESFHQFENPTVRWVLPFSVLLAVGMVSASLTSGFEWLYPLRLFAVAATLAWSWRSYRDIDWSVGWQVPAVGLIVFLIWAGADFFQPGTNKSMPTALAAASPFARNAWLGCRTVAAIVTVPVAEELAFRGFLYRRLLSEDFESIPFHRLSWFALIITSVGFGLMHGKRWFIGTLAGACYSAVLVRRGRIVDAVAAHATTNALIAIDVLAFNRWQLWY
jgi:exosortase E/protease (VPEID-CTERM system)